MVGGLGSSYPHFYKERNLVSEKENDLLKDIQRLSGRVGARTQVIWPSL